MNYRKQFREDCFYFDEDRDMNATIPCCSYMGETIDPDCAKCEDGYFSRRLVPNAVEFYRCVVNAKALMECAKEYL